MPTLPHVKQRTGMIIIDQLQTGTRQVRLPLERASGSDPDAGRSHSTAVYDEGTSENLLYRTQSTGI